MGLEFTGEGAKKIKWLEELADMRIEFGVVDEQKSTNGVLVWQYAIYLEWGRVDQTQQVARPFFSTFFIQQRDIIKEKLKREYSKVFNGYQKPMTAYRNVGDYLKAQIESSLLNGNWTPLKESTVKAKKGDTTVGVDTGNLLSCIGYVVYKGNSIIYKRIGR